METLSPSIVLAAYAEPLLDGRRVAVFGDATSSLAEELLERGARVVHLYDPDPARAAAAAARNRSKQISVLPLDTADIAVRDGAFDLALIVDLSAIDDAVRLLKRVRRALSPRGAAIIASPNPDAKVALVARAAGEYASPFSYYDLFDAVSAEFPEVRMLGQTPFVGYAVVDFSPEGEPEVSLDSGLVPGGAEEPEWFVVVASAVRVELESFSIVQLPAAGVLRGVGGGRLEEQLRIAKESETRLAERISALETTAQERAVEAARPRSDPSLERVRALEAELAKREASIREIEARTAAANARAADAESEIETLRKSRAEATAAQAARADLEVRVREQAAEKSRLEKRAAEQGSERERLEKRALEHGAEKVRLEKQVADLLAEKNHLEKQLAERSVEKPRLEKQLLEHGASIARLEKELGERVADKTRLEKHVAAHELGAKDLEKRLAVEQGAAKGELEKQLAGILAERDALSKRLAVRDNEVERLTAATVADAPDDVARLEALLRDRGERVRTLEADLREAERIGKELVRDLGSRDAPRAASPTRAAGGATSPLFGENARLRADLEAAGWTIQELEGRLSPHAAPAR